MLDAMLEALPGTGAVIVVDEIQHAEPAAVALLSRLAAQLDPGQRLLLLGRDAPAGLGADAPGRRRGLDRHGRSRHDRRGSRRALPGRLRAPGVRDRGHRIRTVTGGWTAAVVLAAARAQTAGRAGPGGLGLLAGTGAGGMDILTGLVDQILHGLPRRAQTAAIQAAHLPLLNEEIAARATGVRGLLALISRAGLPLQAADAGWLQLIGPVQDLLAARAPARPEVLTAAAAGYADHGRPDLAADLLIGLASRATPPRCWPR